MNGKTIFLETYIPRNWLKKTVTRAIVADFNHLETDPLIQTAISMGAFWEEAYYAEEGHGWPVFAGEDGTEKAWQFLQAIGEQKIGEQ